HHHSLELPSARRPGRRARLLPRRPRLRGPQRRRLRGDALDHGRSQGPAGHLHRAASTGRRPGRHRRRTPRHRRDDGQGHLRGHHPGHPRPRRHLRETSGRRHRSGPGADRTAVRYPGLRGAGPRGQHGPGPRGAVTARPTGPTASRPGHDTRPPRGGRPRSHSPPHGPTEPGADGADGRPRLIDGEHMTSTGKNKRPAEPHAADRHDLIRVHGARENNLKDVSVELPKRRLTVFTGVSGSGKSSLVFDTIAAESQRMINETYSAFLQGFMPTLARPEVDVLDGLTTAITVDQQRMGSDPRSTVGTATDANAMLRILFSRLGKPYIAPPSAVAFNTATVTASGGMTDDRCADRTTTEKVTVSRTGGMCTHCEGRGTVSDIDLTQLYDDSKSLSEDPFTIPTYTGGGWTVRVITESGFFDPDKPIRKYTKKERHDFLYREPTKVKINGINLTYEGLIPKLQKSMLNKDREAMQPHIRAFVDRAVTFATCPECDGTRLTAEARSSKIGKVSIADACAMEIR